MVTFFPVTNDWRSSSCVGVSRLVGIGGTWQEAKRFVSPMLSNRMCSREVMEPPGRERPLIYTLWTRLRPGSRTSDFTNGAHRMQRGCQEDNHPRGN